MGCCQSKQPGADDGTAAPAAARPVQRQQPDSSQAAINQPQHSSQDNVASDGPPSRPNKPLRPPTPMAKSPSHLPQAPPPWSRTLLERERASFFDTRVTGRQECWEAVRLVCEMLRQGNVADAQGVLDAANLSVPQGRVAIDKGRHRHRGGVYDERGELYDVPLWVVADPQDVVEDEEAADAEKELDGTASDSDGGAGEEEGDVVAAAGQQRREEKGKGRAEDIGELLSVRCRLSNLGSDVVVEVGSKQKVTVLVRNIQQQIGPKRLRLVYLGRTLMEGKSLEELGWQQGHVINAMVFEGDEDILQSKDAGSK
ncbi:hypothetical protein D0863_01577 [Hortaea werneckii]|uniref:Ubiquitin-like domain-containing protein n=1 Tax=Hortaea werneckii TaxID=91943 RepID=A0A3M7EKP5_HORWE|nr:hypothetical protein D0863_01577 [Hortaea werneckii]